MKITVATMERLDRRAIPQMPWPEVQPPPSLVPKPTSRPAPVITVQLAGSFGIGIGCPIQPAISGARMSPAIKAMRQSLSSLLKFSRPPKIPLMPAMRPVKSISKTADRPIRPPPIAAESGVIFAMMLLHGLQEQDLRCAPQADSQPCHAQPQGIANHAHRRQCHGRGGDDRREQDTEMGIQDARGNRDAGGIVDERKEKILPDVAHGRLRDPAGANDAAEIPFQQGDA